MIGKADNNNLGGKMASLIRKNFVALFIDVFVL